MKHPSEAQCKAICHVDGPAILIAGPGSGKTFTIVQRISYLIKEKCIPPDQILVVTFSKAAAMEMQSRFLQEIKIYGCHFGTFHSLAFYILRSSFGFQSNSIITENEKFNMMSQIFKNHGFSSLCNQEYIFDILNQLSKNKNSSTYKNLTQSFNSDDISNEEMNEIIIEYQNFVLENTKLDFDDMILLAIKKLNKNPNKLKEYQKRYRYILVDEFQDINLPQYELIRMLSQPLNNLFVVGDDDQAIYRFRGSTPGIMKKFIEDYPETNIIFLTENYRSGKRIIEIASKMICQNEERFDKNFKPIKEGGRVEYKNFQSRSDEEKDIINLLMDIDSKELNNWAIILRTNRDMALFKDLIKKFGICLHEINYENKSFLNSFIMEDMINFLSYIYEGHSRESFLQIMNKPNRYIQRISIINPIICKDDILLFYSKNESMKTEISTYFSKLELAEKMPASLAISLYRKAIGYDKYLKEISSNIKDYEKYLEIVQQIEDLFKTYDKRQSVRQYINDIRSEKTQGEKKQIITDGIRIITMHTAKGLEYDNVIIPDVNEGVIPSSRVYGEDIEEERRLLYVAFTRAKNNLFVYSTKERNREVSRFIKDLF